MKKILVRVMGRNASGAPDIIQCEIECSAESFEEGDHYEMAKVLAAQAGFEPVMAFDESDPAWTAVTLNAPKPALISSLGVAAIAREIWGNPIPSVAYEFAQKLQAAMIESGHAHVGLEASYRRTMDALKVSILPDGNGGPSGADFIQTVADQCLSEFDTTLADMRVGVVVGEEGFLSETGVASDEFNVIFDLGEAQSLVQVGDRMLVLIPGSFMSTWPHPTFTELVDAAQAAIERGETYGFSISAINGLEVMLEELRARGVDGLPLELNPILRQIMLNAVEMKRDRCRDIPGDCA